MPELPEVEFAARNLDRWAKGRRLRAAGASEPRALGGGRPAALKALAGMRFDELERRGKNLLLTFVASAKATGPKGQKVGVWSHLGMTGKWVRRAPAEPAPRFSRVRLDFEGGVTLHFVDMRLFGFFRIVPGATFQKLPVIAALGADPLREGIDAAALASRLARRRKLPIKVAIMDQALIPGVGNIQASEGLFRAAIDPRRSAASLEPAEVRRLARALLASFRYTLGTFATAEAGDADVEYVEESGTRNPFKVYDRADVRCPRCKKGVITRLVQAGRSTYFCPNCQK
jgi:formamidopyrimidine-DNA glycosylase